MAFFRKIILLIFIGIAFLTCKKEELPQSSQAAQPVFFFNGNINGTPKNWQAGVNNYYMYSSYTQDSVGVNKVVYGFSGTLQSTNSNTNSVQIIINDKEVTAPNASVASHIDTALSIPYYGYSTPSDSTTKYFIKFTPTILAGTPIAYTYNFGDGNTSNALSPTHTYTSVGTYTTSLKVNFATGSSIAYNTIKILSVQPQLWMDSAISGVSNVTMNTAQIQFTGIAKHGVAPLTFTWNYGDASTYTPPATNADTITVTHTYDTINRIYSPSVTVTDHNGNSQTYNFNVWAGSADSTNGMYYSISAPQPITTMSYPLSKVIVNYIDGSGNVYTSNNNLQPGTSTFQILSVSSYQSNLNNNPTKMLNITFNCMLYPILGGAPIPASNCTAIIAVAYH
jgi:hypothetical protein